jgi:hypothetical protein
VVFFRFDRSACSHFNCCYAVIRATPRASSPGYDRIGRRIELWTKTTGAGFVTSAAGRKISRPVGNKKTPGAAKRLTSKQRKRWKRARTCGPGIGRKRIRRNHD